MVDIAKTAPAAMPLKGRLLFGAMSAAVAMTSLLTASCASRCTGCMGCVTGGAGLVGMLLGAKTVSRIMGRRRQTAPDGPPRHREASSPRQGHEHASNT